MLYRFSRIRIVIRAALRRQREAACLHHESLTIRLSLAIRLDLAAIEAQGRIVVTVYAADNPALKPGSLFSDLFTRRSSLEGGLTKATFPDLVC
jgi:hypothetical protein